MKNTTIKLCRTKSYRLFLFLLLLLNSQFSFADLSYTVTTWNGSATAKSVGNYLIVEATGFNGAINFTNVTIKSFDYPSSIISKTYDNTIQTIGNLDAKFGVYYDENTGILHVLEDGYMGAISIENDTLCYGSEITLTAVDVDLNSYTLEWGTVKGSDTTWMAGNKNKESITYDLTTYDPVLFVTKLTSTSGEVIVNQWKEYPSLQNCGYYLTVSDNSLCLSNELTLSTTYTSASKYEWIDNKGNNYGTTSTYTTKIVPKESGLYTFSVYANGLKVGSAKVNVKTMNECGYDVTSKKDYLCVGGSMELKTNFTATSYTWKDQDNNVIDITTEPSIVVTPEKTTTYKLYADGFYVGSKELQTQECTFFIATKFPIASCLQDTNYLMASGTAMLDDLHNNEFLWEKSTDLLTWSTIPCKSYKLPMTPDESFYYRVTYNGISDTLYYPKPDCSSSSACDGLETKTLFFETFGFFMTDNVYVVDDSIMIGTASVDHTTSVTIDEDGSKYVAKDYDATDGYFTARASNNDKMSVSLTERNNFSIQHYVAPDALGHVVTATDFVNSSNANQFVGTNGHLYLTENPLLRQYEGESWVSEGALRLQDGYYAIVSNPDSCDHNKNHDDFITCSDHTGNTNGAMLFVNAGQTQVSKSAIYAQKASLACPADRFNFGMSVRNATNVEDGSSKNPVNLTICLLKDFNSDARTLPSENDDNVLARISSGDVKAEETDWTQVDEFIRLKEKVQNVWVVIYNNGEPGDGNDMLLDDITFSVCIPKANLVATMNGDTLSNDVVTCTGEMVTLKASQASAYINDPLYIFQYQKIQGSDTIWTDLKDYASDEHLMTVDTVDVSTKEPSFWGNVVYRVIISDDSEVARKVADGQIESLTDCEFTYHQALTDITIRNTYGGEMFPRDSVSFCNIEGTIVQVPGARKLAKTEHEWKMSWLAADSSEIFSKMVKGISKDTLELTVVSDGVFSATSSDGTDLGKFNFSDLDSVYFKAEDEGGCEFYQVIKLHSKMNLDIQPTSVNVVDCNSVTVKVARNYKEPSLVFNWSSTPGIVTVLDDTTQTFEPSNLENYSIIDGKVIITPVNVDDKYCFLQDTVIVPYTVHNGHYEVKISSSKDPVCVSTNTLTYDTEILSLIANVSTSNMTAEEAAKIDAKLTSFSWKVIFADGSSLDTVTTSNTLNFSNKDLLDGSLSQIKAKNLRAYIVTTTSDVCETVVQDTTNMGTGIEIREGGFTLFMNGKNSVCLNDTRSQEMQIVISPATALMNISTLDLYANDKKLNTFSDLKDTFSITVDDAHYPSIFRSGNTETFKVSVYDETCKSQNESNEVVVKYNGYSWNFNQPDSCLPIYNNMFNIIASIDSANAVNHITSYNWSVNGTPVSATGLQYSYPVNQSMTGTFKLVTSDGICPDVQHEFTSNISINYTVSLSSVTNKICSTDSAMISTIISPLSSRKYIDNYKWIMIDKNNAETVIKDGTAKDSFIVLSKQQFPDLFVPGNSFKIYVICDDNICDPVQSSNSLSFDVNVPFKLNLSTDKTDVCYKSGDNVVLNVTVEPEDAINHIENFVWTRNGNHTTASYATTTTSLDLSTLEGWLTPCHGIEFTVSAYDGICVSAADAASDKITMNVALPYTVNLRTDKDKACSENDQITLVGSNTQGATPDVQYTYLLTSVLNGKTDTITPVVGNDMFAVDQTSHYTDVVPGNQIYYMLSVNDGDVCGPVASPVVPVTLQTPFKVHIEATKPVVCKNEAYSVYLVSIEPAAAQAFMKMYSWQETTVGSVGELNQSLYTTPIVSGSYTYFANISDGICYGTDLFPPLQSDTVTVKVNEPIQLALASSAKVYCQSPSSEPFIITATASVGEPVGYALYTDNETLIESVATNDMSHSWTIAPTTTTSHYMVYAYDNVCPPASDPAGILTVDVHIPFDFSVVIPEEDMTICLGEKVRLSTVISEGFPTSFKWKGLSLGDTDYLNTSSSYFEDIPSAAGDVYYEVTASDNVCPDVTHVYGPVSVHEQPIINLTASKSEVVVGSTVDLTAEIYQGHPLIYDWVINGISFDTTEVNYVSDVLPASSSKLQVFATDGVCPTAYSEISLGVLIPTAFTPFSKDGMNDVFMKGFDVIIFDRYGMKVFEGNDGWNGQKGDDMADPGVYYCQVVLKDGKLYNGTIEIVKID